MGVPFSSQTHHQLPLLGVVPSLTSLKLAAWDRSAPLLVTLGFLAWPAAVRVRMCMCGQRNQEGNNGSVLAPLARYTPEGQNQQAVTKRGWDKGSRLQATQSRFTLLYDCLWSDTLITYISYQYKPTVNRHYTQVQSTNNKRHHIPSNSYAAPVSFELWLTTRGAPLNTNQDELFWFCSTDVMLFLVSTPAQPSRCKQHFDNNLREVLQDLHVVMATLTKKKKKKSKLGFHAPVAGGLHVSGCKFGTFWSI